MGRRTSQDPFVRADARLDALIDVVARLNAPVVQPAAHAFLLQAVMQERASAIFTMHSEAYQTLASSTGGGYP